MKRFLYLITVFLLASVTIQANDYLERQKHYMVYSAGSDRIHFKVPVWAYGRAYDYYLGGSSRIYYIREGQEYTIANVCSDRYDENETSSEKGTAYVKLANGMGSITVSSMADGSAYHVRDNNEWTPQLIVVQKADDDCPQVTFLEFDWYPPASMYGSGDISIRIHPRIHASINGNFNYEYVWDFGRFSPGTGLTAPQLFTPYLYALNENGVTGYGNAGIPYAIYYEPKSYTTSIDPTFEYPLSQSDRSGTLLFMTSDTVIEQVTATFKVVYNAAGDETNQKSTAVDIPPYHRIYDFDATEETDETGTYTGNNQLEWRVKNPNLKDLVEGDYFEIQRATKSDYSDAQTIGVMPMETKKEGRYYTYSFIDNSRSTWSGNAEVTADTIKDKVGASVKSYPLTTLTGTPLCNVDVDFYTDMIIQPSIPVYYRIRRASSAIWGWEGHDFAQQETMYKHNFLAPLATTQEPYTIDLNYAQNHKVHFRIKLENAEVSQFHVPAKEDFNYSYTNITLPVAGNKQVTLIINNVFPETVVTVTNIDNGEAQIPEDLPGVGTKNYTIASGSKVIVKYPSYKVGSAIYRWQTESYDVVNSSVITLSKEEGPWHTSGSCSISTRGPDAQVVEEAFNRVYNHLRDSLYDVVTANVSAAGSQLGKCMWDRTARLVLMRTTVETGQTMEFIIPSDQITRQADGSWIATYSDVASSACTHYTYAVRIDQSSSDLRLYDPEEQLKPIPITGPDLYYDEGATITEFKASQGMTDSYLKQGVLLNWKASSANVDEYLLLRIQKNSDNAPDTLYSGTENSFFDRTAIPDIHYEYTVTAIYQCNSKRTVNSATAEGWRTPYGEIRGVIQMSDNSGVPGVTVALQKDGQTVSSMTTQADGSFRFDSLLYDLQSGSGTQYVVIPSAAYGTFVYNYTGSHTATISLTTNNPIASDVLFINDDAVRLTGRVLFKGSTIPVAGAMFLLNGDTIKRSNAPLTTGVDGSFELILTKSQPYRLQVFKAHHTFEGNGILRIDGESETFALNKALDGVRFYDETRVRLVGRVAGGNDQRDTPEGFRLGKNNLGDDLKLVLQLEGDNIAQIVHDPNDATRDTIHQSIDQTQTLFEKKRITIHPDIATGEYAVDLFPVKYKVVQATAQGYATLFAQGQGSETFDLTNAPKDTFEAVYFSDKDSIFVEYREDGHLKSTVTYGAHARGKLHDGQTVVYNAVYDRIYHTPVKIRMAQLIYGLERDGIGEPTMQVTTMNNDGDTIPLYTSYPQANGTKNVHYLLGYPVFYNKRNYQFMASAYEEYFYNNDAQAGALDRVPMRGGKVRIHNGLHNTGPSLFYDLDAQGRSGIILYVDNLDVTYTGEMALRTVSAALEIEGNVVETEVFRGYIVGDKVQEKTLHSTPSGITLLDVARNPGGTGSNSWIESGATYSFSFKESYKFEAGIDLHLQYGIDVTADIGVVSGAPGNYTGATFETSRQLEFPLPFTVNMDWGYQYDYAFTTSERISTSSTGSVYNFGGLADASAGVGYGVGGMADVFVGVTNSVLSGKAKTISIINDSIYQMKQPAINAGAIRVITSGEEAGKRFYLVAADKVVLGTQFSNTFIYSQYYILYTIIPRLAMERQNLLSYFPNEEMAQAAADRLGKPVYWVTDTLPVNLQDTLEHDYYKMLVPSNHTAHFPDEVRALENMLSQWADILATNERIKVYARMAGKKEGTYSVSFGNSYTRTDNYSSLFSENSIPAANQFLMAGISTGENFIATQISNHKAIYDFIKGAGNDLIGKTAEQAVQDYYTQAQDGSRVLKSPQELGTKNNQSKITYKITPVFNYDRNLRNSKDKIFKKNCGFTLIPDAYGDITVSVYRAPLDKAWGDTSNSVRKALGITDHNDSLLYSSYVFYTEAGATFCPYEGEYRTAFYNPGTILSNATVPIAEPELTADTYEVTNVQPDQPAYIRIEMKNNGQLGEGRLSDFRNFELGMVNASNADGLEVYADGNSLAAPIPINILPGQTAYKTLKIMRGTVDDYNDLRLRLYVASCPKNFSDMSFSVHFMPQASPVSITTPRANWVMNTLSPHDSVGYYLPIEIGGFNLNQKNFDHIEFQYKLSSQSDEMWVNLCSFFASDSLYELASGNKAMIENGRIQPFRFYGEKDPVEQKYDLRAVTFCRYGNGFVSKPSAVVSGVKDTRPPRVFGEPEPVNAILGVGDNLRLRFNEPIAGNYLDADNNFQIKGVTNTTGITAGTSLYLDGTDKSYALAQVNRSLNNTSFSIDMLVKPAETNRHEVFFVHADERDTLEFGLTNERKLYLRFGDYTVTSLAVEPMLDFTRVCVAYDNTLHTARFYVGTKEITDPVELHLDDFVRHNASAPVLLGRGFHGNMLDARLWLKPLTQEEIAATHLRYLTGYERELVAYYPLNEGTGSLAKDRSNGAHLNLHGTSWTLPNGISAHLTANDSLELASNLLARSTVYDATYMFWFRAEQDGSLFRAGWAETDSANYGLKMALEHGQLVFHYGDNTQTIDEPIVKGSWHHIVLAVNRTYNNAALYIDSRLGWTTNATDIPSIAGDMYVGGGGFEGNVDEFVLFEQALPKTLIEEYANRSPFGDEMGLMAYLPFEQQIRNPNGVLELVFSVNDRRIFKDPDGNIVNKTVPLVLEHGTSKVPTFADKANYAPVTGAGLLSTLHFDWAFNSDELMINLAMNDREINKQTVYITVRDVEDMNGNPMVSPVSWLAYVDRNNLKWGENELQLYSLYGEKNDDIYSREMKIINNAGKRHQFTIESLPEWLTVKPQYGSLQPVENKTVTFSYSENMPVGVYSDLIYLTDENGLSEPLQVTYTVEATPPYTLVDKNKYPLTMSLCGKVVLNGKPDADDGDKVFVLYRNECIGMASVNANAHTNAGEVFLTIYGNEAMSGKAVSFILWQASTGKTFNLATNSDIAFKPGDVIGCGADEPVLLATGGSETQNINLASGWTWVSFHLDVETDKSPIRSVMSAAQPWSDGDIIKNPATQQFVSYSNEIDAFVGMFKAFDYHHIYMVYARNGNVMRIGGNPLTQDQMSLTIRGKGQWSPLPCLLSEVTPVTDALAGYYDFASPGDIIKAHDCFSVFSTDKKWVGDLLAVRPGEGYLFRRLADGDVELSFHNQSVTPQQSPTAKRSYSPQDGLFTNPKAATNMTMIAAIEGLEGLEDERIRGLEVYMDDELVGVAEPLSLVGRAGEGLFYFLTIQSNKAGTLDFRTADGQQLIANSQQPITYHPDRHCGSLEEPVILTPGETCNANAVKRIEEQHIVIIRNGNKYDLTGRKME